MTPRATYRLQFHADFTFDDARKIVPYLDALGISHVYASPITTATPGSTHGYDVTDPTRVNPELGGEAGLRALVADLHERSMGLIIDIVPNHMGIAGDSNAWWLDVLEHGQTSRFAPVFDIEWQHRLILPVLGSPLADAIAAGDIRLVQQGETAALRLYDSVTYPIRPDDPVRTGDIGDHDPSTEAGRAALMQLCGRQHYALTFWRAANDLLNWRRFFAINELAGVRAEDPEVFELTHQLYFDLFREGLIDGVRIDHVDGLSDPAGYCRHLRARFEQIDPEREAYIVVEKILAADEQLAQDWALDGTSGYDFMREVSQLIHVAEGIPPLRTLWSDISGRPSDFDDEAMAARGDILSWQFEGQLGACVAAFHALAAAEGKDWITTGMLRRAVEGLLRVFPVYRTYGDGLSAPEGDVRWREQAAASARGFAPPGEEPLLDQIADWLSGSAQDHPDLAADAVRRFQQLAAPIAAKGVEDTAFYRHSPLLSLNDVGFDPARPAMDLGAFHEAMKWRAKHFPKAMLTTATHDHKRGEDARARLAVLSAVPDLWQSKVQGWLSRASTLAPDVDPADAYALLQTLVGAWEGSAEQLQPRLHGWQDKALREAQLRSSWANPDEDYEARYRGLADSLLADVGDDGFLTEFESFMASIAPAALANGLAQTALRCLLPGVPDLYQGSEGMDYSMVDPDNRRSVDHGLHARTLADPAGSSPGAIKLRLIARLLALRRQPTNALDRGEYIPIEVHGARAANLLAFRRRHEGAELTCAVAIRLGQELVETGQPVPSAAWWGDTHIVTNGRALPAAKMFPLSPVYVL